jgi:ankyrin repeat protein
MSLDQANQEWAFLLNKSWLISEIPKEKVQQLVKAGADVNMKDKHGRTGLRKAVWHEQPKIALILLNAGAQIEDQLDKTEATLLFGAVERNYPKITRKLLNLSIDIDKQDRMGDTALIRAACLGQEETTQLLLDAGADRTKKDNYGRTAVDLACCLQWKYGEKIIKLFYTQKLK